MPAPLDVDKEAIRLLVVEYGVTETAKQTNIPLNTLLSWSARGNWLKPQPTPLPPTVQPRAINAIQPSQAQANIHASRKQKAFSNLSKYVVNGSMSAAKSRSPLADAANVKALAGVFTTLWPEKQEPGVSIQVLSTGGSMG